MAVDDPFHSAREHDAPDLPVGPGPLAVRSFIGKPVGDPGRARRIFPEDVESAVGSATIKELVVHLPLVALPEDVVAGGALCGPARIALEAVLPALPDGRLVNLVGDDDGGIVAVVLALDAMLLGRGEREAT